MQHNNSKILNEIINTQRLYHDNSRLGYNQTHIEKGLSSMTIEEEEQQITYAEVTRGFTKKEEWNPSHENDKEGDYKRMTSSRILGFHNKQPPMERNKEEIYRGITPFKRYPRYQTIFLGSCYSYNNFGHKVINYKVYAKNRRNYEGYTRINHLKKTHEA
jgi:hypothetical protein